MDEPSSNRVLTMEPSATIWVPRVDIWIPCRFRISETVSRTERLISSSVGVILNSFSIRTSSALVLTEGWSDSCLTCVYEHADVHVCLKTATPTTAKIELISAHGRR